jgi:heme-degrading monooxygenase HmoA
MPATTRVTGICPIASNRATTAPATVQTEVALPGFVALSRFVVANGLAAEVKAAFRNRPHLVEGAPGYLRMDVISPLELPEELWLITFWADEASFRNWHRSHLYRDSHAGIPKGLKLVRGETQIRTFEHVAS